MTTLLIDGDILLYEAANRVEKIFDWGNDLWSIGADMNEAKGHYLSKVAELELKFGCDSIVCVSDPRGTFRHDLYEGYKSNRRNRKPLCFKALRDWAIDELGATFYSRLEADDTIGILATSGMIEDPVVVTIDKDLKSVPGRHYNWTKDAEGIVEVTKEEADKFHLLQTMTGDSVDGYSGIPGVGPKTALKILEKEGYTWETVVKAYEKAKLLESDARLNAWMAKILTADLWDFEKQEFILWNPRPQEGVAV